MLSSRSLPSNFFFIYKRNKIFISWQQKCHTLIFFFLLQSSQGGSQAAKQPASQLREHLYNRPAVHIIVKYITQTTIKVNEIKRKTVNIIHSFAVWEKRRKRTKKTRLSLSVSLFGWMWVCVDKFMYNWEFVGVMCEQTSKLLFHCLKQVLMYVCAWLIGKTQPRHFFLVLFFDLFFQLSFHAEGNKGIASSVVQAEGELYCIVFAKKKFNL